MSTALQNAQGWSSTIRALVAALECDYDRLDELREERADLVQELESASGEEQDKEREARAALDAWDTQNGEELRELTEAATVDGEQFNDADTVRDRIAESALAVEVRGDWHAPGDKDGSTASQFRILLTTGGPAMQIMGDLGDYGEPRRAWLEYQDWGTPWTEYHGDEAPSQDELLAFAQCFYFGEG